MFQVKTLFQRTFLLIVTSLSLIVSLFSFLSITHEENTLMQLLYSETKTISKSIALVSSDAMVVEDFSFIVEHNEKVLKEHKDVVYIIVTKKDADGINIYNYKGGWKLLDKLPLELKMMYTTHNESKILKSEFSANKNLYHFSYPVIFSGIEWGWISIGFSLEKHKEHMKQTYLHNLYLLLVTLSISLIFSFILARWLVKPIVSLNEAIKQVSLGNYKAEVRVTSHDEVGELAKSFNGMVETIQASNERMSLYSEELEKRVKERTQELYILNKELDDRVKTEVYKRAEQEQMLIQQSRFAAMGEMIGNIAHQWRQPLNALGLLLQNVENAYEMDILDDAYVRKTVEKGNRLTQSMSQTIDDFRNFFKPNKTYKLFNLSESLYSTMDLLKSSLENNAVNVKLDVDESIRIKGFASEFSQVLLNIVNNARDVLIEKVPEGREMSVRVFKDNKNAYVEVEDNARGIAEEIFEKIFDPYFTTKDEGKGTGIGLYMSKTIIENSMKGQLKVINSDRGAKFTIVIALEPKDIKENKDTIEVI
jgi:signal transduction histidine kinase